MIEGKAEMSILKDEAPTIWAVFWLQVGGCIAIYLAILGGLYGEILWDLILQWWNDPNYSHGFLVPLFSGFLVWQRRWALRGLVLQGSWLGLVILLAGIGELVVGDLA